MRPVNLQIGNWGKLTWHRFSDFQVNEISEDGSVLHLQQIGIASEEAPVSAAVHCDFLTR